MAMPFKNVDDRQIDIDRQTDDRQKIQIDIDRETDDRRQIRYRQIQTDK